jgi:hypothetical protein
MPKMLSDASQPTSKFWLLQIEDISKMLHVGHLDDMITFFQSQIASFENAYYMTVTLVPVCGGC